MRERASRRRWIVLSVHDQNVGVKVYPVFSVLILDLFQEAL